MKKLMFFVVFSIMMGMSTVAMAQEASPTKVERQGNTFKSSKEVKAKSKPIATSYYWEDRDGTKHPLFMGPSGACFYYKKKKDGTEGKQYVPKEVSAQICKEMGVEYKPKNK